VAPDAAIIRAIALMLERSNRPGAMPVVSTYRGAPIHDYQTGDRVESLVQPSIDRVLEITDPLQLFGICCDVSEPPEARLLARSLYFAKAEAKLAAHDTRLGRLTRLEAATAGLDTLEWQDPDRHASLLDTWPTDATAPSWRPPALARRLHAVQARE
jgi:hypothetical protein